MMQQNTPPPASLSLGDIYYVLFRHKWKIVICILAGVGLAIALLKTDPALYQSEAKLLVRYVVTSQPSAQRANDDTTNIRTDNSTSIMATEREILSSMDLAREVVQAITPEKLLAKAGGGKDLGEAIKVLQSGLKITIPQASSVIQLTFRHPDPDIVQPVMAEIVNRYLKLHVQTHRASGMLSEALVAEADNLRSRLRTTEDDLRGALNKAGIVSLESAKETLAIQLNANRREVLNYETELASREAVLDELKKRLPTASQVQAPAAASVASDSATPSHIIDQYRALYSQIEKLQSQEQDLATQFTAENSRLKLVQSQLSEKLAERRKLREQYPILTGTQNAAVAAKAEKDPAADEAASAWIQIAAYRAKIKELNTQYENLRAGAAKLDQVEGNISELIRKRALDAANYEYYRAKLEQVRINETLGSGKVSNISVIQAASPAFREVTNYKKSALALVGGLLTGLAWAFLIESYLDRSVRRPGDILKIARVPLFLSIPKLKSHWTEHGGAEAKLQLAGPDSMSDGDGSHTRRKNESVIFARYHETLRDRLIGFFESKNLTHKPKLVAVTSVMSGSGVTTTAAGLARSLSETGEGNVLLVDMTLDQGAAQQFSKGKAVCGLDELLETRSQAHVYENLYVVNESNRSDQLSRNLPKRFSRIIPQLKASDFDYIIFDMPAVSQLSITPRLASFMDMVLLVVESEKTDGNVVQGACDLLAESKIHVGVVLNKTRNYVPARFQQELMPN